MLVPLYASRSCSIAVICQLELLTNCCKSVGHLANDPEQLTLAISPKRFTDDFACIGQELVNRA